MGLSLLGCFPIRDFHWGVDLLEMNELIAAATAIIKKRFLYGRHTIGAAVKTRSGKVFVGVNLDTYLGNMSVCAESVALGWARVELGADGIDMIVAVRHPPPEAKDQTLCIVPPCGACRERIYDYDAKASVILMAADETPVLVPIEMLLPFKYRRPEE